MEKNYNYTRDKLHLPEYGRHIQNMVDALSLIEDRDERNRQARAVIAVMGNLNPMLRDTADFTHKLWDHMFIISDFKLDIDSPYPRPSREEFNVNPRRMKYSNSRISFKHYGKYVGKVIESLSSQTDHDAVAKVVGRVVRFMRAKSYEYNEEHPNNEVIAKDIKLMSKGAIEVDEVAINNIRSDYKQGFLPRGQKSPTQKSGSKSSNSGKDRNSQKSLSGKNSQNNQNRNGRNSHQSRNFTKSGPTRYQQK